MYKLNPADENKEKPGQRIMATVSSEGFYIILPSNTIGCYTVDQAQALKLNRVGSWDCVK